MTAKLLTLIKNKLIEHKDWVKAAAVRAIRTFAQTAIATVGVSALMSEVDWLTVLSASVLAGVLSVLTSLTGLPKTKESE